MRRLLLLDAVINLLLGILLVAFPESLVGALGLPSPETAFYPSILRGVLVGVGMALLLERAWGPRSAGGLGLGRAAAIDTCGALVLEAWLVFGGLDLPFRAHVVPWLLVVLLLGLSSFELYRATR